MVEESTHHIQHGFCQVAVELGEAVGELGYIDGDQLIRVLYSVIQRRDAVEGQIREVLVVNVLRETCPILQRQLCLVI